MNGALGTGMSAMDTSSLTPRSTEAARRRGWGMDSLSHNMIRTLLSPPHVLPYLPMTQNPGISHTSQCAHHPTSSPPHPPPKAKDLVPVRGDNRCRGHWELQLCSGRASLPGPGPAPAPSLMMDKPPSKLLQGVLGKQPGFGAQPVEKDQPQCTAVQCAHTHEMFLHRCFSTQRDEDGTQGISHGQAGLCDSVPPLLKEAAALSREL